VVAVTRDQRDAQAVRAVDLFCGAGGLSWGLVETLEGIADRADAPASELVDLHAVNHWERAIETHETNHPWAEHYHAKVEELRPREVVGDEPVDILTGGPECTHFSRARGGKPVDEQKRASPWHVLDWVEKVEPQNVLLENVPEFEDWGPIDEDGTPSRNGELFEAWVNSLHALGYNVDWRVLNAADYGDATTRERFFLIGRREHRPEFPEPSHSEDGTGDTEEWRPAVEIIDWSDLGESVWSRDRPLVNNTMQRIAEGIRRHGADELEEYADAVAELGKEDVAEMQQDIVDASDVADAIEARDDPFLVRGEVSDVATDGGDPATSLCVPYLIGQHGGAVARAVDDQPAPTVTTDGYIRFVAPQPFVLPRNGYHRGLHSNPAYDPEDQPLHTVTAKNHDGHLVTPYLVPFYGERDGQAPRTQDVDEPLPTIPASKVPAGVCRPYLVQYYGQSDARSLEEPLPTVTTRDRFALVLPEHYPWGLDIRFRMLQPRELAAAMGFPDEFQFVGNKTEIIEQIGNAVPVNLASALCERLLLGDEPTLRTFGSEVGGDIAADGGVESDD
jgi:DNA (cytosine-5)-methyltransferase 1